MFDSSGPEGKVRGTPQQIIEKYNQLARDAQLAGDRVATEAFQQHAEHYTRLLAAAQKEMDAKREQQDREHRERQQQRNQQNQQNNQNQQAAAEAEPAPQPSPASEGDSGLVETPEASGGEAPEAAPKPKGRGRARAKAPAPDAEKPAAE